MLLKTIEDRFVPRDDGSFIAQGRSEGRQRKLVVIASGARQSSLFFLRFTGYTQTLFRQLPED